jgi:probable selenate reductase FAD-binding subunit
VSEIREYLRPASLDEAIAAKQDRGNAARYLAGGTDLLVMQPPGVTSVIDIMDIGLDTIGAENGSVTVGSAALLRDIERHPAITGVANGALTHALQETAPWLIRNQATLCGNICNASPSADSAPMLMGLDAELQLSDGRIIGLDQFFVSPHHTVLNDELVVDIRLYPRGRRAHYSKLARSHSDIALVNLAITARAEGEELHDVRIALGSVAPTTVRAKQSERLIEGQRLTKELLDEAVHSVRTEIAPISDWRTSAEYRLHAAGILVRRALCQLLGREL